MANFIGHGPCPRCKSSDASASYSDGSTYCFSCKAYTPSKDLTAIFTNSRKTSSKYDVKLPEDCLPYLPVNVKNWLEKYSLTKEEYNILNPLYSFETSLLIFPVYASGDLVMYQGRYFGDNPEHPKYVTRGAKDVLHIIDRHKDSVLVCTEDLVSAVKVSTVMNAMPVWGSGLPFKQAIRLSKRFKHLVLWLDMDKASDSLKMASKYSGLFDSVRSVVTEKDPKEYTHEEIRNFLN